MSIQELYCYYDLDENRCKCGAKKNEHENCIRFLPTGNGRPCSHLRPDTGGGCDNAYACFEAYANSLKPNITEGEQDE
jgi:hypothetical protein